MGLYANQALVQLVCKAGEKLKERKERKRKPGGAGSVGQERESRPAKQNNP